MRPFELLLVIIELFALLYRLLYRPVQPAWMILFAVLLFVAAGLHLALEKPRWQMVPLYALGLAILILALVSLNQAGGVSAGWWIAGLVLLGLFSLPPVLMPVPRLAVPDGPYPVGTTVFDWVDEARAEIYPPEQGKPRRIRVQVWYPAAVGTIREPFFREQDRLFPALAKKMGLPAFTLNHIKLARTNAYRDAPVASGTERFPVLVFSHGWTGVRVQNIFQMEMLASHGYVVFAADHTYGAAGVAFADGTLALNYAEALPKNVSNEVYDQAARKLGLTWLGDIRFMLDQAGRLYTGELPSPLAGRFDLDRLGILGHSTGGGAAVELCWSDPRCKAGLAMDAWLIPYSREMLSEGVRQPFLFMQSEHWHPERNIPLVQQLVAKQGKDTYRLVLDGFTHETFSDLPALAAPWFARLQTGRLFGPAPEVIISRYELAFFDRYLKGQHSGLLESGSAPLPGVHVEIK